MKVISGIKDVKYVVAGEVEPGMITLDGVVLGVHSESHYGSETTVFIEHRHTTYAESPSTAVQVYGKLDQASTSSLLALLAEAKAKVAR